MPPLSAFRARSFWQMAAGVAATMAGAFGFAAFDVEATADAALAAVEAAVTLAGVGLTLLAYRERMSAKRTLKLRGGAPE